LNATHTHTAPVLKEGEYAIPTTGVTQASEYREFFIKKVTEGIVNAWKDRDEAEGAWGLSYAVVGQMRRVGDADGTAGTRRTTSPPRLLKEGQHAMPPTGVTQATEYREFFIKKVTQGIVNAWKDRAEAEVAWALSYAVVGHNRRVVYAAGPAGMSTNTNLPEFRNIEGPEDHDVNMLFFWNKKSELIAMVIGVASPSQEIGGMTVVHADYWDSVRRMIYEKYGKQVCVVSWLGASGD